MQSLTPCAAVMNNFPNYYIHNECSLRFKQSDWFAFSVYDAVNKKQTEIAYFFGELIES